jgi:hypothetical protein
MCRRFDPGPYHLKEALFERLRPFCYYNSLTFATGLYFKEYAELQSKQVAFLIVKRYNTAELPQLVVLSYCDSLLTS